MNRVEIKTASKQQLGSNIFGNTWLMGLLFCFLAGLICGAAGTVLPGIGAIIITGPISYGISFAFLKLARGEGDFDLADLFKGFQNDFGGNFLIGLMTGIFTALWSMLFVIPGIVKSYAYSMAFYVKVDHPEYGWSECINESKRIMNGHKGDLFIQDLSFIGWMIVGWFCLGIGTLWVIPYYTLSRANFYESVKNAQYAYAQ